MVTTRDIARRARAEGEQGSSPESGASLEASWQTRRSTRPAAAEHERTERLEALTFLRQRQIENAMASLLNSNRYAPANHPCVKELTETVRWAAEELGMPPDSVSLHVFQAYTLEDLEKIVDPMYPVSHLPQAFVIPETGAIFINVQMLEALSYSRQLVNAVLYHEVAHLQLKRDLMAQVAIDLTDPLFVHQEAYEIEYHCDRLAAMISSRRKEDPASIGDALAKLTEAEARILEKIKRRMVFGGDYEFPTLMTHPVTERRIRENVAIIRHLSRTDLAPDSRLPEIKASELSIDRPLGRIVDEANTFGMFYDDVEDGIEDPPTEFGELLLEGQSKFISDGLEARSRLFSDWFVNLCYFLNTEDGEQFKHEFASELAHSKEATREALAEVLEHINLARIVSNDVPCESAMVLSEIEDYHKNVPIDALDLIVRRYIELQDKANGRLGTLADLVEIGERGDRKFGTGAIFISDEMIRICCEVARNGSDEEKTSLVTLIDRTPNLQDAIIYRMKKSESPHWIKKSETLDLESLGNLLRVDSKTMFIAKAPTKLTESLEAHNLERWIGSPLSSREVCVLPICIRREPDSTFEVSRQELRNGREYELVVVGDTELTPHQEMLLKEHLTETIDRGLRTLSSRTNRPLKDFSTNRSYFEKTVKPLVSDIAATIKDLQSLKPKTLEERCAYMENQLAAEFERERNNQTLKTGKRISSTTSDDAIDAKLALDIDTRIRTEGTNAVEEDLTGVNRNKFSHALYTQYEDRLPEHIQLRRLWRELYQTEFDKMPVGFDKARFLIGSYPIKTCDRDQLICESLALPPLRYLDDMGSISEALQRQESIEALLLLRDSLHCEELAQVAEVRLFELFERDSTGVLRHSAIAESLPAALKSLPDNLQRLAASDERLLGVIMCFANPSRERDRHLMAFRDGANNREEKEALGALFSDPNLASTQGTVVFQKRQDADTVFATMGALGPYDKAQALLYFMGYRNFFSPLKRCLIRDERESIGDRKTPLEWNSLFVEKFEGHLFRSVEMPDALIRAQKAFGIAISTVENLRAGLLNERTLTDVLRETLYGRNGIASELEILSKFFDLAGVILIKRNPQLEALDVAQKRKLASFLSFAFQTCPESRLPSVILKVWEASRRDSEDPPALVAAILSKLGPAFVKFGQRLSQLDIDAEYKRAFRKLCSENAQVDTSFVYHNLSITCPSNIFDESRTGRKIAEGSMAATFEGTLKDSGKTVCIKMIHPAIRGDIDQDIDYITELVGYMNRRQVFPGLTIPANTPEIIRQQLVDQIDTDLEINRTEHLRNALRSPELGSVRFVVPEVLDEVSGKGVIVFEFMPSYELDKEEIREQGFDDRAISNEVGLELLRMLVEEEHYQSDVNLGNFGVLKNPESGAIVCDQQGRPTVVWYDAGAVETIDSRDQKLLLQIVLAAVKKPMEIPDIVSQLVQAEGSSADSVRQICTEFGAKLGESGKLELTQLQEQLQEFIEALSEAGFAVEDRWLVIANTLTMAAPLLSGIDEKRLTDVFTKGMQKHGLISKGELFAMRLSSIWR